MSVRVCSFESRRCQEMTQLISKFGGSATVAPSMREVPMEENVIAGEFAERLIQGEFEIVLFMTGVGAATLFEAVQVLGLWENFQTALNARTIIIRGPKPVPVLKNHGIHIDYRAPEPNTWREVLEMIDQTPIAIAGKQIAVQEYGKPNPEFYAGLEERGASVFAVPVYRWEFPIDVEPLYAAIREQLSQPFELLLFTSANQVDHVLEAAQQIGLLDEFLASARKSCIASIGPTCSERLQELNLPASMEPSHPKMAHLVREALEYVANSHT